MLNLAIIGIIIFIIGILMMIKNDNISDKEALSNPIKYKKNINNATIITIVGLVILIYILLNLASLTWHD